MYIPQSLESGGLESGGLLWGFRVSGSTRLGLPISELELYIPGGLESGGLESGFLLWGSSVWGSRVGGSTGLGLPISEFELHMPVLNKQYIYDPITQALLFRENRKC